MKLNLFITLLLLISTIYCDGRLMTPETQESSEQVASDIDSISSEISSEWNALKSSTKSIFSKISDLPIPETSAIEDQAMLPQAARPLLPQAQKAAKAVIPQAQKAAKHVVARENKAAVTACKAGSCLVYNWVKKISRCTTDSKLHCSFYLPFTGACYACDAGYKWTRAANFSVSCVLKPAKVVTKATVKVKAKLPAPATATPVAPQEDLQEDDQELLEESQISEDDLQDDALTTLTSTLENGLDQLNKLAWKNCAAGSRLLYSLINKDLQCVTDSQEHCQFYMASIGACFSCEVGYDWTRSLSGAVSCVASPAQNLVSEDNFVTLSDIPKVVPDLTKTVNHVANKVKTLAKKTCASGTRLTYDWVNKTSSCVSDSRDHCEFYLASLGACFVCQTGYNWTRSQTGSVSC